VAWTGDVWLPDAWTAADRSAATARLESGRAAAPRRSRPCDRRAFRRHAATNWDAFYRRNATRFFKDRHYLHKAFPRDFGWLYDAGGDGDDATDDARPGGGGGGGGGARAIRVVEIGCGVGNAILPLLEKHAELTAARRCPPPALHVHCLDFAPTAIELLTEDPRFRAAAEEGRATAHVCDLSATPPSAIAIRASSGDGDEPHRPPEEVLAGSADVAILLFCLSAVGPHPSPALDRAARHAIEMLKPGGVLVLRDYGRLDEAQLKLGAGATDDHFCQKGDGTGCYYFELDDLRELFVGDGDKLEMLELDYIHRMYRNRGEDTVRRRVWVQGRFRKPACRGGADAEESAGDSADATSATVRRFLDTSIRRWDEHYKALAATASPPPSSPPSNLWRMFPEELRPWACWQPAGARGKRRPPSPRPPEATDATEATVVDLGCGVGNDTLLDLVARQQTQFEEDRRAGPSAPVRPAAPPLLHVHFVDASPEAIRILRSDARYRRASRDACAAGEPQAATARIASHVADLASAAPVAPRLEGAADVVLLLFALSAGRRARARRAARGQSTWRRRTPRGC